MNKIDLKWVSIIATIVPQLSVNFLSNLAIVFSW